MKCSITSHHHMAISLVGKLRPGEGTGLARGQAAANCGEGLAQHRAGACRRSRPPSSFPPDLSFPTDHQGHRLDLPASSRLRTFQFPEGPHSRSAAPYSSSKFRDPPSRVWITGFYFLGAVFWCLAPKFSSERSGAQPIPWVPTTRRCFRSLSGWPGRRGYWRASSQLGRNTLPHPSPCLQDHLSDHPRSRGPLPSPLCTSIAPKTALPKDRDLGSSSCGVRVWYLLSGCLINTCKNELARCARGLSRITHCHSLKDEFTYDGHAHAARTRRCCAQNMCSKTQTHHTLKSADPCPLAPSLGPGTCWITAERMNKSSIRGTRRRRRLNPGPGPRLSCDYQDHFHKVELDPIVGGPS